MGMKRTYSKPRIKGVMISYVDIVCTSGGDGNKILQVNNTAANGLWGDAKARFGDEEGSGADDIWAGIWE